MAGAAAAIGNSLKPCLIPLSMVVVGVMLLYELYGGRAVMAGTRSITRRGNPFRYWFWMLFHAAIVAVLSFAWLSGVEVQ
jgi:CBS domain containing-hemolysin-like protein